MRLKELDAELLIAGLVLAASMGALYWRVEASERRQDSADSRQTSLERRACRIERGLNRLLVDAELRPEPIPRGEDVCQ